MPITKDPKTGKVTHHSYSSKSKTYDQAVAKGHKPVAKSAGRKTSETKRAYS